MTPQVPAITVSSVSANTRRACSRSSIPLQPGKTVSSVTLPMVATLPGVYPMHVFALGLDNTSAS